MFATELFSNKEIMQNEKYMGTIVEFVKVVMPSIVHKTVYEKAFIAKEAKTSVSNSLDVCIFDDMLSILIDKGCNGNTKVLQENGYTYC